MIEAPRYDTDLILDDIEDSPAMIEFKKLCHLWDLQKTLGPRMVDRDVYQQTQVTIDAIYGGRENRERAEIDMVLDSKMVQSIIKQRVLEHLASR